MSTGKEAKAAVKKAAAWGTPQELASGDAILFTTEKINRTREHLPDDSAGQAFHSDAERGAITCGGDLSAYLRYQGLEVLLALALGQAGEPVPTGAGAYTHALGLQGSLDGIFGTLAIFKGFSVHEYPAVKVDGFSISGEAGKPLTVSFSLINDDLNINTTAGVNTSAGLAAIPAPPPGNRVLFRQGQFWINDAADVALSAAHAVHPNRFSLSCKRKLSRDYLAGGQDRIAEPVGAGFPELSLTLEFPTYTSDTFLNDLGADTRKKMRIAFTGGQIASGLDYSLEFLLPHLVITNAQAAVDKAGKIAHPITMECLASSSERAGMSGLTAPLALNLINTTDSDPLA
ncbi:MAG: phage tail tube protein [Pseudomonadota bacterium]